MPVVRVANNVTVSGADNKNHALLTVPDDKQGVTISVTGTAASATVNVGHQTGSSVTAYENSTIAVGEQLSIQTGAKADVFAIVASATATTNIVVTANTW